MELKLVIKFNHCLPSDSLFNLSLDDSDLLMAFANMMGVGGIRKSSPFECFMLWIIALRKGSNV